LFGSSLAAVTASAQVVPPTREEVSPPVAPAPAGPRVRVDGGIERAPCPLDDPAYANLKVTVTAAVFNNLKGVSPEELAPAYRAYLAQERPISVVCDIRDAAATLLRNRGYLAAVQVPVQKIENGEVRFEVLYARLAAVRVRGEVGGAERLIASYLEPLTRQEVFNRIEAERSLLLVRDLPGYDVRLTLRPAGTGPGEVVGDVTVTRTPYVVDLNVQNLAGRDTGPWGAQLRAQFFGLTGLGDRTSIAFYSTADFDEQQILQLAHDFRIGGQGLTISSRFNYAWTEPDIVDAQGNPFPVKARTLFANLEAGYPFLRTQAANLRGALGLDFVNQEVKSLGTFLNRDRLRVAYVRLDVDATDPRLGAAPGWRAAANVELRQGLDLFDARSLLPRAFGDRTATLARMSAYGEARLAPNLSFSVAPRGQYAFDRLLSFERFSGGNYTIGRGYDPGTVIGDHGLGLAAELKVEQWTPFGGRQITLQPFAFADAARVWEKGGRSETLTSVGAGVRSGLFSRARLDATLAVPLERAGPQNRRGDVRFLVSLTTKLLP
jgi:hemolysin activation/secretion protein